MRPTVCSRDPEATDSFPIVRSTSQKSASGRASLTSSDAMGKSKGERMMRSIRHKALPLTADEMKVAVEAADAAASIKAVAGAIAAPMTTWSFRKASLGLLDNRA